MLAQVEETVERSLERLVMVIRSEQGAVGEGFRGLLPHVILIGESLAEAKSLVGGGWEIWCEENLQMAMSTAANYMRIAYYKDHLSAAVLEGGGFIEALTSLKGMPALSTGQPPKCTKEIVRQAQDLRKHGMGYPEIAELFNVSRTTAQRWSNPKWLKKQSEYQRRYQKKRADERRALLRQERDSLVRNAGGDASLAYEHVRKMALLLDALLAESSDEEQRAAYRSAAALNVKLEKEILRALEIGRGLGK